MNFGDNKNSIKQRKNGFYRILTLTAPFDKRDPDPSKNYGIHGIDIRFELVKNHRAVQFVMMTPIHLPEVWEELKSNIKEKIRNGEHAYIPQLMGADVGYHSPEPIYEGQEPLTEDCTLTGGICYYDGSGLRAEEWKDIWLREGTDKIWEMLEEEWRSIFEN